MTIKIRKPELERLVQEEILNGHFQNVDDLFTEALQALREKHAHPAPLADAGTQAEAIERAGALNAPVPEMAPRKNLVRFLLESPFAGSDLNLERHQDYGRSIEL